jgi:hypothetical protein
MTDVRGDQVLFDHVAQIVQCAILQGVVLGQSDAPAAETRKTVDEQAGKAASEVTKHLQMRINQIRAEDARETKAF